MRIAFILPSLANKGPVLLVQQLVGYLLKAKHQCQVYYFDDLVEISFSCPCQKISFFKAIPFSDYDVIHSHLFRPDLYCWFHRRRIKNKVLSTIHTAIYEDLSLSHGLLKSRLVIPLWEMALKSMDQVVVLNKTAQSYYQHLKLKKLSIINNGISLPEISKPIPVEDAHLLAALQREYILLGSVCAIDKRKGLEQVIALLALEPHYAYVVVGDGQERKALEALAITHGVEKRFHILGFRSEGYRYQPYFQLSVLPSRSEGMPIALLEAMALKVPAVCARISSLLKEFPAEEISYFDLDDVGSLQRTCREALRTAAMKTKLAYVHYQQAFSLGVMGERYLKLYNFGLILDEATNLPK